MLKSLSVWNFALIENANIEFDEGLNILTGETGAGKSILIDALGVALGSRANGQYIRNSCDELKVEVVFQVDLHDKVNKILEDLEIENDDGILIITRKITKSGKNSIVVNGSHVTLSSLKKIGSTLIDVHGQNENLALLKEGNTYKLIDNYSDDILATLADYQKLYRVWRSQLKLLETKKKSAIENDQRLDMLKWQENEISEANLKVGEDKELEDEIRRLSNAENIVQNLSEACNLLDGENDFNVLSSLARIENNLHSASRYDKSLNEVLDMLEGASITLRELSSELHSYEDKFDFSPGRLDKFQERLETIQLLKKKYGATIGDILERHERIKQELQSIENFDEDVQLIQERILKVESQAKKRAEQLVKVRRKSAKKISDAIEKELRLLGMKKARFVISVDSTEDMTLNGSDEVDMLFSANAGEELQPLSKVASGGELSRLALAIKTIDADNDDSAATMIFDEIDTGLGGVTANSVAECIAKVARYKQVLCITHLAQIACMADVHISINKTNINERTVTQVKRLLEFDRIKEIARMASGVDATPASIENAKEMIKNAYSKKRMIASIKF